MATEGGPDLSSALEALSAHLAGLAKGGEGWALHLRGEQSDFVRLNRGQVRQPGRVEQLEATLRWYRGKKQAVRELQLTGRPDEDRARIAASVDRLRGVVGSLEDDPHLLRPSEPRSTEELGDLAEPTEAEEMVRAVVGAAAGADLVGILAAGTVSRGFADERGQRNLFAARSTLLDYSVYRQKDKAVKARVASRSFDSQKVEASIRAAVERSALLNRPERSLLPGSYRAYLAPAAVAELFDLAGESAFGLENVRSRRSPLTRLYDGRAALDERVTLSDRLDGEPAFSAEGWVRPARLPLIERGRAGAPLASARSAAEHGVAPSGVDEAERPASFELEPGGLAEADVLEALGTGLLITDLWYGNWSDRPAARMTAMTRFSTTWVEDGREVAPLQVMRFDDSLYRMLGESLVDLTRERTRLAATGTYGRRALGHMLLPGILLQSLELTL